MTVAVSTATDWDRKAAHTLTSAKPSAAPERVMIDVEAGRGGQAEVSALLHSGWKGGECITTVGGMVGRGGGWSASCGKRDGALQQGQELQKGALTASASRRSPAVAWAKILIGVHDSILLCWTHM